MFNPNYTVRSVHFLSMFLVLHSLSMYVVQHLSERDAWKYQSAFLHHAFEEERVEAQSLEDGWGDLTGGNAIPGVLGLVDARVGNDKLVECENGQLQETCAGLRSCAHSNLDVIWVDTWDGEKKLSLQPHRMTLRRNSPPCSAVLVALGVV